MAIVDERLNGDGIAALPLQDLVELCNAVLPTRVGEVGGPGMGSERHAFWHAVAPHFKWLPEDRDPESATEEMRRGGQAVGTSADNHHVKDRLHEPFFLQ